MELPIVRNGKETLIPVNWFWVQFSENWCSSDEWFSLLPLGVASDVE